MARERQNLNKYRQSLAAIAHKIRKKNAQPICITQAFSYYRKRGESINGNLELFFKLNAYNQTLMDYCRKERLSCIDLGNGIEFQPFDHWDKEHTTHQGSKRIANFLCKRMLEDKIVGPDTFTAR